jgi:selenocysteine lyase/cysteine desulfurase
VELLIDCLGLTNPTTSSTTLSSSTDRQESQQRPVVFIGPYEHHSNLIPWRESGCEIVMIPECDTTRSVDLQALETALSKTAYQGRLKIGTFTAASNVTGKLCDVDAIASMLKKYDALAFFDYATAGSYVKMDMNPVGSAAKDAIFLSPHKILGGVGTPGILVVKKHLVSQVNAPRRSGGGTVFYVTDNHHRFLSHRVARYEGGTPMIPGIVRAGLTFLLKRQVDRQFAALVPRQSSSLLDQDTATRTYAVTFLKTHAPELVVLGADDPGPHLPILSFLVRCEDRFLHYNFVCALLNDVFGIQSRGGCQCAGPYSQILLGLRGNEANVKIEKALYQYKEKAELLRPGYTRVSLPFKGMRRVEMNYVLQALVWIAKNGWALLCHYRCNHRTGEWRHSSRQGRPLGRDERRWLNHFHIGPSLGTPVAQHGPWNTEPELTLALENANQILAKALSDPRAIAEASKMVDAGHVLGGAAEEGDLEDLRWYVYPQECAKRILRGDVQLMPMSTIPLGALAPRTAGMPSSLYGSEDHSNESKKRKIPSELGVPDQLYTFRDGSHSGEAFISEIANRVDNGELSHQCEIIDPETDEWVIFERYQSRGTGGEPAVPKEDQDNSLHDNPKHAGEKKKAPRTQCDWGVKADLLYKKVVTKEPKPVAGELSSNLSKKKKRFVHEIPPPKMMRLANQVRCFII